jgi:hypothetical protein
MLDSICTNETRFFREPRQFEFLESEVRPQWRQRGDAGLMPKRVRAWSAACSTGEEPYSLAMLLRTHFPIDASWTVEILAYLGQGRHDVLPAGDLAYVKLVGRLLRSERFEDRATEEEIRAFFAPYEGWAGLAGTYAIRSPVAGPLRAGTPSSSPVAGPLAA